MWPIREAWEVSWKEIPASPTTRATCALSRPNDKRLQLQIGLRPWGHVVQKALRWKQIQEVSQLVSTDSTCLNRFNLSQVFSRHFLSDRCFFARLGSPGICEMLHVFAHGQLTFETLLQFVQSSYLPLAEVDFTWVLGLKFRVAPAMTLGELISAHPKIRKRHGAPSHAPSSSCSRTPTGYGWILSQSVTVRVVMMKHHFDTCSHLFHLLKHIWHIWVYKGLSQVSCISTNWYGPFSCHKQTTPKYLKNLEIIKVKLETSKQRQSAERTIQDGLVGYMFPTIVNNHKHQRGTPSFIHVYPMIPPWSILPIEAPLRMLFIVHPILRNSLKSSGFTISCSERLATSSTLYFTSRTCRNGKKLQVTGKVLDFLILCLHVVQKTYSDHSQNMSKHIILKVL